MVLMSKIIFTYEVCWSVSSTAFFHIEITIHTIVVVVIVWGPTTTSTIVCREVWYQIEAILLQLIIQHHLCSQLDLTGTRHVSVLVNDIGAPQSFSDTPLPVTRSLYIATWVKLIYIQLNGIYDGPLVHLAITNMDYLMLTLTHIYHWQAHTRITTTLR